MSHDNFTIGQSENSADIPPGGIDPGIYANPGDRHPGSIDPGIHAWVADSGNIDPGIYAGGGDPRGQYFNDGAICPEYAGQGSANPRDRVPGTPLGDGGPRAGGPRDGGDGYRWAGGPDICHSGQTTANFDATAVTQAAANVSKALQSGDLEAASQYAASVDPRDIRSAKMDLFGNMRDARPEDRRALMQQARELNTLQRASFAFELINRGEDREGMFLLHHLTEYEMSRPRPQAATEVATSDPLDPGAQYPDGTTETDPVKVAGLDPTAIGDGTVLTNPDGTAVVSPEGAVNPDGTAVTNPDGTAVVSPEGAANPDGTALTNPDGTAVVSPEGAVNPDGTALTNPDGTAVVSPEGTAVGTPDGAEVNPDVSGNPITGEPAGVVEDPYSFDGGDGGDTTGETIPPTANPSADVPLPSDAVTVPDTTDGATTATAASPLRSAMSIAQQAANAGGTLTPEMKQQFEAAIAQADSGESPVLAGLRANFDTANNDLNTAISQEVVTQIQALDGQAVQQMSALSTPEQQSQAMALYQMLDAATSAEDKAQIRSALLTAVPGMASILDQRDQVIAPFQDKLFAVNSLGQEITAEQNQGAVTRMIYAQSLATSGDIPSATKALDEAIAKNTDQSLASYLEQAKQSLTGTAAPVPDSATDSTLPAPAADSTLPAPAADSTLPAPAADSTLPAPAADSTLPAPATDTNVPSEAPVDSPYEFASP